MTAHRRLTQRLVGVSATVVLTVLLGLVGAATSWGAVPGATSASAVDNYGSCLAADRSGDLLLLIDQSSSLQSSDPQAARVTAAEYLVDRLQQFSATAGVQLSVGVAGFDAGFTQTVPWTTLDAGSAPSLREGIEAYRDRNQGFETDYWSALDGARRALADQVPTGERRCQAVAWFSDGTLDISPRLSDADREQYGSTKPFADGIDITDQSAADQVIGAASESICRAGGLADQLRAAGVITFGIGLANGTAVASDFDLMKSAVTGEPTGGSPCGEITSPPPGQFQLATDLDGLLFAFDALSTPGRPPLMSNEPVCQVTSCENQHRFVLDSSIGSVTILGQADVPQLDVGMVLPDGTAVPLPSGPDGAPASLSQGGVDITYSFPSPTTVSVTLQNSQAPGWTGQWALVFIDRSGSSPDAVSRANIHITGDLVPAWLNQPEVVRSGEPVTGVQLGLRDSSGAAVEPSSLLGSATLTATLFAADDTEIPVATLDEAAISTPVTLDLTSAPTGPATLRLTLAVTTAGTTSRDGAPVPGTQLEPASTDVQVDVAAPLGFPVVAGFVNFGSSDTTSLTGRLDVTGPGCVWIDPAQPVAVVAAPEAAAPIRLTADGAASAAECRQLAAGEAAQLPLTLSIAAVDNGGVNGTAQVTLASAQDPSRTVTVPVEFTASVSKPLNTTNFLLALVAALLLGPGIPLALLYAAKRATAKVPPRPLSALRVGVEVRDGQVLRDGIPFELRDTDLRDLVPVDPSGSREVTTEGLTLRATVGRSPVGPAYVLVHAGTAIGASSSDPAWHRDGLRARLPLAVHNTWVVLQEPHAPEDRAEVLLLVGGETTSAQREALVVDMNRRLASVLARLRAAAGEQGLLSAPAAVGAGSSHPFGGTSSGADGHDPFGGGPGAPGPGSPGAAGRLRSDPFSSPPDPFSDPPPGDQTQR